MNRVLVLNSNKQPLMPTRPARARRLLSSGRAAVYRRHPFTIILKEALDAPKIQPIELKLDPGSKTTGLALVGHFERDSEVLWAANLSHRGQAVKANLDSRRSLRRGRRTRKTRYRAPRFRNRTRPAGWLPPSLLSRVANVKTWARRLLSSTPLLSIAVETVRFDTQLLQNPDIDGVEYQQGTLFGTELREYLLYRHHHTCAYCVGLSKDPILEREHVVPTSKGGTNRVSNQVIACQSCNQAKGGQWPKEWLAELQQSKSKLNQTRARNLEKILEGVRPTLKDAAAVNAPRYRIGDDLKALGLPTTFWSGGQTKLNRSTQGYPKDHWIDAACVGESGSDVLIPERMEPLQILAQGRGSRQMCRMDRFGFPRTKPKRKKRVQGFQTGDLVRLDQPSGKYAGIHFGVVAVRERGDFDIKTFIQGQKQKITARCARFTLLQRSDGYAYAY